MRLEYSYMDGTVDHVCELKELLFAIGDGTKLSRVEAIANAFTDLSRHQGIRR